MEASWKHDVSALAVSRFGDGRPRQTPSNRVRSALQSHAAPTRPQAKSKARGPRHALHFGLALLTGSRGHHDPGRAVPGGRSRRRRRRRDRLPRRRADRPPAPDVRSAAPPRSPPLRRGRAGLGLPPARSDGAARFTVGSRDGEADAGGAHESRRCRAGTPPRHGRRSSRRVSGGLRSHPRRAAPGRGWPARRDAIRGLRPHGGPPGEARGPRRRPGARLGRERPFSGARLRGPGRDGRRAARGPAAPRRHRDRPHRLVRGREREGLRSPVPRRRLDRQRDERRRPPAGPDRLPATGQSAVAPGQPPLPARRVLLARLGRGSSRRVAQRLREGHRART
jgi:hypothetical protein